VLPKRLRVSTSSSEALKLLKARTGLTPNIICRLGLILSLEVGISDIQKNVDQSGIEFNATTLFGEHSLLFEALILQKHGYLSPKELIEVIVFHIDSGLALLRKSRNLLDLIEHCGNSVSAAI
jgi:DNA sulfur modification protein DndE